MTDFATLLDEASLPEVVEMVCFKGALKAEYQELELQLAEARDAAEEAAAADSHGDGGTTAAVVALEEQLEAVRVKMAAASVPFKLRALSGKAMSALLAQHQPRPEDRGDLIVGYNRETMGRAMLRACIYEPAMSAEQWERVQDVLNTAELQRLDKAAASLNFAEVSIPFSQAALKNLTSSESV